MSPKIVSPEQYYQQQQQLHQQQQQQQQHKNKQRYQSQPQNQIQQPQFQNQQANNQQHQPLFSLKVLGDLPPVYDQHYTNQPQQLPIDHQNSSVPQPIPQAVEQEHQLENQNLQTFLTSFRDSDIETEEPNFTNMSAESFNNVISNNNHSAAEIYGVINEVMNGIQNKTENHLPAENHLLLKNHLPAKNHLPEQENHLPEHEIDRSEQESQLPESKHDNSEQENDNSEQENDSSESENDSSEQENDRPKSNRPPTPTIRTCYSPTYEPLSPPRSTSNLDLDDPYLNDIPRTPGKNIPDEIIEAITLSSITTPTSEKENTNDNSISKGMYSLFYLFYFYIFIHIFFSLLFYR